MAPGTLGRILNRTVIVSALGYFVDIYDLIVFSLVSVASLQALGYAAGPEIRTITGDLLGIQMLGMLVGGVLWGVLGDKRGRISVLFGSIALYSIANIANAFVVEIADVTGLTGFQAYAGLRFVSGVGLAGELGAAITLVSEVMSRELRGYGTAVVSAIGILGAVGGGFVALAFDWKAAYLVGGILGLVLLVTRMTLVESGFFKNVRGSDASRGNLLMLLAPSRLSKFIRTTLVGLPIWCIIALFFSLSAALAPELGVPVGNAGRFTTYAVMTAYAGASLGGLLWGLLSQAHRTRRGVLLAAVSFTALFMFIYFFARGEAPVVFYTICFFLGLGAGYWSVFVTAAAEQFGTNLRATVTTIVPNVIRGTTFPLTWMFNHWLVGIFGTARSALILGTGCMLIALWAIRSLPETFGKDLDYVEADATAAGKPAAAAVPKPLTA